jgi:hypothetical protein
MDKLVNRLPRLPLILAGPILRQVTEKSVTVWVAIQNPANVTVEVRSGDPGAGVKIGEGSRPTVAVGGHLHIVAVTAKVDLVPGVVYTYDMYFDQPGNVVQMPLVKAVLPPGTFPNDTNNPLNYAPYQLPSFSLPPSDANDVRIIFGSCRMPHGNGNDALAILDDLIRGTASNAVQRPHQLLLTGDQIYADDVAAVLLMQLTEAGTTLLGSDPKLQGWGGEETLPAVDPAGGASMVDLARHPHKPSELGPLLRRFLLGPDGADFTSDDLGNHLLSLGEYLSMYLFVWSDVLWPPTGLPTTSEVEDIVDGYGFPPNNEGFRNEYHKIGPERDVVQAFFSTLPKVRRALANVPSYMICDDHEVTDDWNMTLDFCKRVYGNPLGRRVVQNALLAYALCQHWGNAPEQFDDSGQSPAGLKLLKALDKGTTATYDAKSGDIQKILGIHDYATLIGAGNPHPDHALFHDQASPLLTIDGKHVNADSLQYHYTIEGKAHQVIVTDTRTWRSFPNGGTRAPQLIPKDQFNAQIESAPTTGDRALMVVLTTNAPPIEPIRVAMQHDRLIGVYEDLFESWEPPWAGDLLGQDGRASVAFDRLLATLADRVPTVAGKLRGGVVLLSGDVHHSFASRLIYRSKTARFENRQPPGADVVFAQLVGSSFKKVEEKSLGLHREGYAYPGPLKAKVAAAVAGITMPPHKPEGYVGWNIPVGSTLQVGKFGAGSLTVETPTVCIEPSQFVINQQIPISLTRPPDYRYRLDYLSSEAQSVQPPVFGSIPAPSGDTSPDGRRKSAQLFNTATGAYRDYNTHPGVQRDIVGVGNIGEITFTWGKGDDKQVHSTVRWWNPSIGLVVWTRYTVSLNPDDPNFKDIL